MEDVFELVENKESDIDLPINVSRETLESESEENSLQRTELWQEERKGNWTGSRFKNCMQCNQQSSKLSWDNPLKIYHFSKGAIKYIYENAMERKTGRYIESSPTWEMKYGTKVEPLIEKRFNEELISKGFKLKLVGYKEFPEFNTAGVSSDAIVLDEKENIIASAEFKACTSWSTHYDRTFESTDDSSTDFWQTQGQMIAWNVDETFYIVISPPKDIKKYLFAENIMDFYEDWVSETEMNIEVIKKSPIHHNALMKRLFIMESTINNWLSEEDLNLKEVLYNEIDFFKKKWNSEDVIFLKPLEVAENSTENSEATESITETQNEEIPAVAEASAGESAETSEANAEEGKELDFNKEEIPF